VCLLIVPLMKVVEVGCVSPDSASYEGSRGRLFVSFPLTFVQYKKFLQRQLVLYALALKGTSSLLPSPVMISTDVAVTVASLSTTGS